MKRINYFFVFTIVFLLQSCSDFIDSLAPKAIAIAVVSVFIYGMTFIHAMIFGTDKKGAKEKERVLNMEKRANDLFASNNSEWDKIAVVFNNGTMQEIDVIVNNIISMDFNSKQKEFIIEYCINILKYREVVGEQNAFSSRKDLIDRILKEIRCK